MNWTCLSGQHEIRNPVRRGGAGNRGVWVFFFLLFGFVNAQPSGEGSAAGGVRVPQINDEGVLTSLLTGEQVRITPGKPLDITRLTIRFFAEDGETENMKITAPTCLYDAARGRAKSDDTVRVEAEQFTIDGKGFEYRVAAQRMEIFSEVKVVLRHPSGARLPLVPEPPESAVDEETGTP